MSGQPLSILGAFREKAASIHPRLSALLSKFPATDEGTGNLAGFLVPRMSVDDLTRWVSHLPAAPIRTRIMREIDDRHNPETQAWRFRSQLEQGTPWGTIDRHQALASPMEHKRVLATILHENPGNPDLARYIKPTHVPGVGAFLNGPDQEADSHQQLLRQISAADLKAVREKEVRELARSASTGVSGTRSSSGAKAGRKRKRDSSSVGPVHKGARGGLYRVTPRGRKVYLSSAGSTGSS